MRARKEPYEVIRDRLERGRTVVLDGGVGSELVRRGVRWRDHGLRTDTTAVQELHTDYLEAGAHVIRTNTFQLNRRIYQNVFRDAAHLHHIGAPALDRRIPTLIPRAVELARAARQQAGRDNVAIAGVMSPLEHCFRPDLAACDDQAHAEHAEIAHLLAQAGVDLLLLESMNTLAEARVAVAAARATGLPVWVSFVLDAGGNVLSSESLSDASRMAREEGAEAVLVNCAPPSDIAMGLEQLVKHSSVPVGVYPHIGRFDPPEWLFTDEYPPPRYLELAREWLASGAHIIGGCCGTTPEHIALLASRMSAH